MIYDTHAHYDDEKFDNDRVELLSHLLGENNIGSVVNVGANLKGSQKSIELAEKYPNVYAAIGVHPEDVDELDESGIDWLRKNSNNPKVVAIGEIGLDYYWVKEKEQREKQIFWFKKQIELAKELNLPINVHSRDACEDTLNIISEYNDDNLSGIIHCFSYTKEIAKQYINMGFYIGVGGVVTFKNGKKLRETVANIPLDTIVIETDCPYMSPEPHRGTRNSSIYLKYVVSKIAEIKNVSEEEVERVTYENALSVYSKKRK